MRIRAVSAPPARPPRHGARNVREPPKNGRLAALEQNGVGTGTGRPARAGGRRTGASPPRQPVRIRTSRDAQTVTHQEQVHMAEHHALPPTHTYVHMYILYIGTDRATLSQIIRDVFNPQFFLFLSVHATGFKKCRHYLGSKWGKVTPKHKRRWIRLTTYQFPHRMPCRHPDQLPAVASCGCVPGIGATCVPTAPPAD